MTNNSFYSNLLSIIFLLKDTGVGPCPSCGMSKEELISFCKMGCPDCYSHFSESSLILNSIQDSKVHLGKRISNELENLKKEMEEAVAVENYELAAEIKKKVDALWPTHSISSDQ